MKKDTSDIMDVGAYDKEIKLMSKRMEEIADRLYPKGFRLMGGREDRFAQYGTLASRIGMSCPYFISYGGDMYHFGDRIFHKVGDRMVGEALTGYFCDSEMRCGVGEVTRYMYGKYGILNAFIEGVKQRSAVPSRDVIAFRNGIWDFSDLGSIRRVEPSPQHFIIEEMDYDFDFKAKCPRWMSFLSTSVKDKTSIDLLQMFFGLGMLDRRKSRGKIESSLWIIGRGGSGKSTIFEAVRSVYGGGAISSATLSSLIRNVGSDEGLRYVASVIGKLFNYCTEIQTKDLSNHMDSFKSLVSGEPQQFRVLGSNIMESDQIPFFVFNMNDMPKIGKMDESISRRIKIIEMNTTIAEEDRDRELSSKLREELAGIRLWMLEGLKKLKENDWEFPETEAERRIKNNVLYNENQTVLLYISTRKIRPDISSDNSLEDGVWLSTREVYSDYVEFCKDMSVTPMPQVSMVRGMTDEGFKIKRMTKGNTLCIFGWEERNMSKAKKVCLTLD